jgi:hypothetical protein
MLILSGSSRFCLQLAKLKKKLIFKLRGPRTGVLFAIETVTDKHLFVVADWNKN